MSSLVKWFPGDFGRLNSDVGKTPTFEVLGSKNGKVAIWMFGQKTPQWVTRDYLYEQCNKNWAFVQNKRPNWFKEGSFVTLRYSAPKTPSSNKITVKLRTCRLGAISFMLQGVLLFLKLDQVNFAEPAPTPWYASLKEDWLP